MKTTKTLKIVLIAVATSIASCNEFAKNENSNTLENLKTNKMELKENKTVVQEFIVAMQNSNVDKLKTMITDDFSWWIIGKPEYLVTAGEHDKDYFLGFFKGGELFPEGPEFKIVSIMAEDNKVATEATFKAKTAMGTFYENTYHFLFIIENGKVKRMKEYMDTFSAKRLLESIPQQ
ncbi:MAG: nuclear transport factor 2 family protein [Flavobacteriales bacterium]